MTAAVFGHDGPWTEEEYLSLDETSQRVELFDGSLHVTPAPTPRHQNISRRITGNVLRAAGRAGRSGRAGGGERSTPTWPHPHPRPRHHRPDRLRRAQRSRQLTCAWSARSSRRATRRPTRCSRCTTTRQPASSGTCWWSRRPATLHLYRRRGRHYTEQSATKTGETAGADRAGAGHDPARGTASPDGCRSAGLGSVHDRVRRGDRRGRRPPSTPGARYADARVMHRRSESMTARNGDDRGARARTRDAGVGVRALVGSSWGFYAVPDLSRRGGPRRRPAGGADRRGQRPGAGPADRRWSRSRPATASWAVGLRRSTRSACRCPTRATCWSRATATHAGTAPTWPRGSTRSGTPASGSSPARGTASTSTSASAAAAISATVDRRRRDAAPLLPVLPRPVRHHAAGSWSTSLDLAGARRADRRRGPGAAHRAALPGRRDRPDPRRRADGPADPRVGRARHRAGPHPRLGGGLRRHVLARPGPARARCATARS